MTQLKELQKSLEKRSTRQLEKLMQIPMPIVRTADSFRRFNALTDNTITRMIHRTIATKKDTKFTKYQQKAVKKIKHLKKKVTKAEETLEENHHDAMVEITNQQRLIDNAELSIQKLEREKIDMEMKLDDQKNETSDFRAAAINANNLAKDAENRALAAEQLIERQATFFAEQIEEKEAEIKAQITAHIAELDSNGLFQRNKDLLEQMDAAIKILQEDRRFVL